MDRDGVFWVSVWLVVGVGIVFLAAICGNYSAKEIENYTKRGYCQIQVSGSTSHLWQKCELNK